MPTADVTPDHPHRPHPALARERKREVAYRRTRPIAWWSTLLTPVVLSVGILSALWLFRGWPAVAGTVGTAVASLFFGKFIILGGANGSEVLLSAEELVVLVVLMDVMAACWFVYHLGFMLRLPVVGPRFSLLVEDGEYVMGTHPWIRRAAFVGLVVFVMVPFAMTGSVGGSILARLLGMTRRATFAAICIGSVLGAGLMYTGGEALGTLLDRENPLWAAGGAIIMISLILVINYRYAKAKARARNTDLST
jgi:uncharacterized membrane protein